MKKELIFALFLAFGSAAAIAETSGTCSITGGRSDNKMSFSWDRGDCVTGQHCHEGSSDMLWSKWSGVTPQDLEHEGASVDGRMKAESGEMRCVGTVHDAALRGTYSFTPDAAFAKRMESMGFDDQTPEHLQGYAMLDVMTCGTAELILIPHELYHLASRTLLGQTIRITYNASGAVTGHYLDGESLDFPGFSGPPDPIGPLSEAPPSPRATSP